MHNRLIPRPIRDWLRKRIQEAALHRADLPPTVMKYLPYEKEASSYVLPGKPDPVRDTGSSGFPVPPREFWLGYGENEEEYLASGEEHVSNMLEILAHSGYTFSPGKRVLDFGCGAGRMIRQLAEFAETCEVWGTDIDASAVTWCRHNLEPPFQFFTGTTIPHLPFADGSFSLVYAGSVFTHIDDLAEAWLLELRRVLSDGGRLYLTLHDQHTMELLATKHKDTWLAKLTRSYDVYRSGSKTGGKIVLDRDTNSQVFYDIEYFKGMLDPTWQVLSITAEAYGYQTAVLLKPKG